MREKTAKMNNVCTIPTKIVPSVHDLSLGAGFVDWFGKSRVIDDLGRPLVVFRGEYGGHETTADDFWAPFQSRLGSLTFSSLEAATLYAIDTGEPDEEKIAPRVLPAFLRIENPIFEIYDHPYVDLKDLAAGLGEVEARRIAVKFSGHIQATNNWSESYSGKFASVADLLLIEPGELNNLYFLAFHYLDDPREVEKLMLSGFDGAIHLGFGDIDDMEYKIFSASQAWSAVGFPRLR